MKKLATMTHGRSLTLGKLDEKVKNFLLALRRKGGVVNTLVAIAAAKAFIQKSNEESKQKMKENHILFVRVLANMRNIFQPLDLTVNGSFKSLMKRKFTEWYCKEIGKQLEENVPIEDSEIKLKVSVLKPLHASWLMATYNQLTSSAGREIITNGWKSAGITEAASKGIECLKKLDPFHSIDPLFQKPNEFLNPSVK